MFKLTISDTVVVKVKGKLPNGDGVEEDFEFSLVCKRIGLNEVLSLDNSVKASQDALSAKTVGWRDVLNEDGSERPFSQVGLQELLNIPGMVPLVSAAYSAACTAKERRGN